MIAPLLSAPLLLQRCGDAKGKIARIVDVAVLPSQGSEVMCKASKAHDCAFSVGRSVFTVGTEL